jgi:hypothetical protein
VANSIDISYAAHTSSCTFLLDREGICRRIVVAPAKRRESSRNAARCVGAQYVASLDSHAAGGLVEMPRVGAAMLFARVDDQGRVTLVRTGVLVSFESRAGEDPFVESRSVETSAPALNGLETTRVDPHAARRARDYQDSSEPTRRIHAPRTDLIGNDLATTEYRAAASAGPRPSRRAPLRPSDPTIRVASNAARAWVPESLTPPAYESEVQVTRQRRGR